MEGEKVIHIKVFNRVVLQTYLLERCNDWVKQSKKLRNVIIDFLKLLMQEKSFQINHVDHMFDTTNIESQKETVGSSSAYKVKTRLIPITVKTSFKHNSKIKSKT